MDSIDVSPTQGFSHIYDRMNNVIGQTNPMILTVLSVIIIFYFVIFSYLGYTASNSTGYAQSRGLGIIEIIMWGLIIFLVLINGIQYFFKIDVNANISNIFNKTPELDLTISPEEKLVEKGGKKSSSGNNSKSITDGEEEDKLETTGSGEVFNIPGNEYTYTDAKALCKAYGGDLASYTQIENAYKSGAEWCNYGWSSNQMALYPTQKVTWNKLQKIKGHEHNCGRPGVNGGYIKDPNKKYGVNCYGYKPEINAKNRKYMDNLTLYPTTTNESIKDKEIQYYKDNIHNIIVAPFNSSTWND